jgi:hypothetical protein
MNKSLQYMLCAILILANLMYLGLCIKELDGIVNFLLELWPPTWFAFNGIFMAVFPVLNIILWKNRSKIKGVDYSLIYVPIILWWWLIIGQFIMPWFGGTCGNFLVINPAMIGTISCLYILRFFEPVQITLGPGLWKTAIKLWLFIFVVVSLLHTIIPPLG